MERIELIITLAATAAPLLAATVTCVVKMVKSVKYGKAERKQRLWAEFAQEAIACVEALKGKSNGELTGSTKKEIAMNKVEAACIKNGIPFERDKVSGIIEDIVELTKKVNVRDKDKVAVMQAAVSLVSNG